MRFGSSKDAEWGTSPLRLFDGDRIQLQLASGEWISGDLKLYPGGMEIHYDEARSVEGYVESSRILSSAEIQEIRGLLRPEVLWTDRIRLRREEQIWQSAHPDWRARARRWVRELLGTDPVAREPILQRHLGKSVLVELQAPGRTLVASGLLLEYNRDFLALADAALPSETSLPLCPGKTAAASLEATWNDEGLELFNRGEVIVRTLGIRTSEGLEPWELALKPGFRERTSFRRAPAGTAEIVFESPTQGDAILSRRFATVRGGSEGSIHIPALPDLGTTFGEIPSVEVPEANEPELVARP